MDSREPKPGQPVAGSKRAQLATQLQSEARSRKRNRIITGIVGGLLIALVAAAAVLQLRSSQDNSPTTPAAAGDTIRDNSHRLNDVPNAKVTLVEFLDFECEACGATYPVIEELRKTYGDQVTFVVRYFPLEAHFNSKRAARAVEAAAQQDKFEPMYQKMFQTQQQWGEQQQPLDGLFRQYAQELGLDMDQWDADYSSEKTQARIQTDIDDGLRLGVDSTPTFFLNGKKLQPRSADDLTTAIEDALAQ